MGVALQVRQAGAVGRDKCNPGKVHHGLDLHIARLTGAQPLRQAHQPRLKLAAQYGLHAEAAQQRLVHRRVQAVHAQMRVRRHFTDARNGLDRDAGGGVHADIQRSELRAGKQFRSEFLQREVDALHVESGLLQPCGRLGQGERLPAQLIGVDQYDLERHSGAGPVCFACAAWQAGIAGAIHARLFRLGTFNGCARQRLAARACFRHALQVVLPHLVLVDAQAIEVIP